MKKLFCYYFVVTFSIIPIFLHAQISVSYQSFQPDDIVIELGQWKMTAKQLEQYGVQPLKVVMVNDGNTNETFVPDRQYLLPYDVYKRLKYYAGPSRITQYGAPLAVLYIVAVALLTILFPQECQEIWEKAEEISENFSVAAIKSAGEACVTITGKMVTIAPLKTFFAVSSSIGLSLLMRQYLIGSASVSNEALFSYIHQEMFFESCKVPAHTSLTKLMFVAKE